MNCRLVGAKGQSVWRYAGKSLQEVGGGSIESLTRFTAAKHPTERSSVMEPPSSPRAEAKTSRQRAPEKQRAEMKKSPRKIVETEWSLPFCPTLGDKQQLSGDFLFFRTSSTLVRFCLLLSHRTKARGSAP